VTRFLDLAIACRMDLGLSSEAYRAASHTLNASAANRPTASNFINCRDGFTLNDLGVRGSSKAILTDTISVIKTAQLRTTTTNSSRTGYQFSGLTRIQEGLVGCSSVKPTPTRKIILRILCSSVQNERRAVALLARTRCIKCPRGHVIKPLNP